MTCEIGGVTTAAFGDKPSADVTNVASGCYDTPAADHRSADVTSASRDTHTLCRTDS